MFRTIEDFLGAWAYEADSTLKILDTLTDDSLQLMNHPGVRALGRLAWHLTQTLPEMGGQTGLKVRGPGGSEPIPASAADLATRYREAADSLAAEVKAHWMDADLEVEDDLYGERWKRGQTLSALISHQTHHRGQMTVLMRQAGLPVPGIYGPSKEEWGAMGMPPQE